jgi:imidazole glycerol phosphate synthase glutamine amidotransferase subunit
MISLIDYGAGNVGSVLKAVRFLGYSASVAAGPNDLNGAEKIILPGQGHFGQMMTALADRRLLGTLRSALAAGKPFLGICLGLQALYEASDEAPEVAGLGILPGRVARFEGVFKVPHVGWSDIQIRNDSGLLRGVPSPSFVYYCHSYYGPVTDATTAVTEYGQTFAAVVEKQNVRAVQFHPEKSGLVGLTVLKNFLES